eukprot:2694536-Amphidinium_carterae.1
MVHRMLTTGLVPRSRSTPIPMQTDAEQPDETMEEGAAAQSVHSSSASSVASSIDGRTLVAMESLMWDSIVSPQCAPLVRQQLQEAELADNHYLTTTRILKTFASLGQAAPIQRDSFIPTAAMNDHNIHL